MIEMIEKTLDEGLEGWSSEINSVIDPINQYFISGELDPEEARRLRDDFHEGLSSGYRNSH